MAQRNPITHDDVSAAEAARRELERLAAEQGVRPITDFDSLRADFWPEDESVDDFVRTVRERRRDSERRSIE
jgi:phage terminase small subunit